MGSASVCPNRTDIGCFFIFAKSHEERGRRVDEEVKQDEEMEEDSTSNMEMVTGQESFIAGTGNGNLPPGLGKLGLPRSRNMLL